ncbi:hypothetical protein [Deinococcus rubellus]|uniref:Uncharacterized protein n=1 Tax=Deinococcus rubellus TaxID=1889240 RepID=A0ABY5YIJ1_9DEIO|nr:hypothetical protein [Deinococcus rubellus]UWX64162.1 hypothetical protein N0D28_00325 [Deinococcus rubellus]
MIAVLASPLEFLSEEPHHIVAVDQANPTTAIKASAKQGSTINPMIRRLRDMKNLAQHTISGNPGGLFAHVLRRTKEVEHPDGYEMWESNERPTACRGLGMCGR